MKAFARVESEQIIDAMKKPAILTLCDYFLPGYKAGGPIVTIANMVSQLSDQFLFKVITANHDYGDKEPYKGIDFNCWVRRTEADVFYLSNYRSSFTRLVKLMTQTPHDVLYLNSFFSPWFTIKPMMLRLFGIVDKAPLVLATRGELAPGAISLKAPKKQAYIRVAKALGFTRDLIWQASSDKEAEDIKRLFGDEVTIVVAPDLRKRVDPKKQKTLPREKPTGQLKVVFLSRVTRMKNLEGALQFLKGLNGSVEFNIYGPIDDQKVWAESQDIIKTLPANIKVNYRGGVPPDEVGSVFAEHDLFLLPTRGENFGHAILEAMVAGCPVLISDRTQWRDLESKGAGWDLPLDAKEQFQAVLQKCIDIGPQDYKVLRATTVQYGLKMSQDDSVVEMNRKLFETALSR